MAEGDNRQAADIMVPAKDPEKKDDDKPKAIGDGKLKDEKDEPEIVSSAYHRSPLEQEADQCR